MQKDLELINDITDFIVDNIVTVEGVCVETVIKMVRDFDKKLDEDLN